MIVQRFLRLAILLALAVGLLCSTAQAQKLTATAVADSGTFDGKLYENSLLGFTMLVPGGWNVFTNNQNAATLAAGRATTKTIASGLTQKERENLDKSISNTQVLFQASSRTMVGPTSTAVLSCGAESVTGTQTKEKYLDANKKLVLMNPGVSVTKDIYELKLGSVAFVGFDVQGSANGKTYRQQYLATIRKGVALFFVTTFWDNKNDFVLDASLKTLKFGK